MTPLAVTEFLDPMSLALLLNLPPPPPPPPPPSAASCFFVLFHFPVVPASRSTHEGTNLGSGPYAFACDSDIVGMWTSAGTMKPGFLALL